MALTPQISLQRQALRLLGLLALLAVVLPMQASFWLLRKLLFASKPSQSSGRKQMIGYWWRDKKGKWHPRVYMFAGETESPRF